MDTKICRDCQIEKPVAEFHINRKQKSGRCLYCKTCMQAKTKKHYEKYGQKADKEKRDRMDGVLMNWLFDRAMSGTGQSIENYEKSFVLALGALINVDRKHLIKKYREWQEYNKTKKSYVADHIYPKKAYKFTTKGDK